MINIISKSIISDKVSGPNKVASNFIKGLDKIGYPYVVNKSLDSTRRLWIQDDLDALREVNKLPSYVKVLAGPNIFSLREIPKDLVFENLIYLLPSNWVKSFWLSSGFKKCILDVWPVGIDTENFYPKSVKKDSILVYFKGRFDDELRYLEKVLNLLGSQYRVIRYGTYKEEEYKKILDFSKYAIWLGVQESQGIALEEAMSSGVPILLWETSSLGHSPNLKFIEKFNQGDLLYKDVTSAEYFNNNCGIKVYKKDQLIDAINYMNDNYKEFKPREYILENLNIEKQSKELVSFYDKHFNLSYEDGLEERILNNKKWKNSKAFNKYFTKLKNFLKNFFPIKFIKDFVK